jgi:capsular polysaccharide biosynthesis protein
MKAQMIKPGGNSLDDADLEREVKADEQNYLRYLSMREQERTADVLDRPRAVGAALATPPAVPTSPVHGRGMIFLFALGLATAVSFPAALILDCFDPCFHTPTQVIETLGIAVVLAVPKMTA